MESKDLELIRGKLSELFRIINELESAYPGRKFSLDGHLLGSIGEVFAEYYYGIKLFPNSTKTHDGEVEGKNVQIKITQIDSVDLNDVPDYLIVLFLKRSEGKVYEVYNGPGNVVLRDGNKKVNSGWYVRSLNKLSQYDLAVPLKDRIKAVNSIDKWSKSIKN